MPEISFVIEPSLSSNDHQVRIIVDGQDIISDNMLGIDPPEFFADPALLESGELIFARCSCGVVGCGDAIVHTKRDDISVTWDISSTEIGVTTPLVFSCKQFDTALKSAMNDHSWETVERTAERLISEWNFTWLSKHGLTFCWASGRLNDKKMSICSDLNNRYQVIVNVPWNHVSVNEAISNIRTELQKPPQEWADVTYHPYIQNTLFSEISISGPGWRRE